MNLLFVESRYQTLFLDRIAERLAEQGHSISWIVQNKSFTPKTGRVFKIDYPSRNSINSSPVDDSYLLGLVSSSDRNINYFGGNNRHYLYYKEQITKILDEVHPDTVFGEATLFHHLICIDVCRARGVKYLNPCTCRYPTGRFSFYEYDTLEPFGGSRETMSSDDALKLISSINNRTLKPDYMRIHKGRLSSRILGLRSNVKVMSAYFQGEQYNTPSPRRKWAIERLLETNKEKWEGLVLKKRDSTYKFAILYPLQMQPEANLDVWGNKYRDQAALLSQMNKLLPEDSCVLVKPNPKSKYEMSGDLIELLSSSPQLIPLPHESKMEEVLNKVDLVVTVTGTVAIECILSEKPVATLVKTRNNENLGCVYLQNVEDLPSLIQSVMNGLYPKTPQSDKVSFLNWLTSTSFRGIISDPITRPDCIGDANIGIVTEAFNTVLAELS